MIKLYSKKTLFVLIILAWPYLAVNSNLKTTVVRYFRVQPKIYFKKVGESQVELRTRIFVHCWTWTKTRIFQIRTNLESNSTQLWRVCRSIRIFDWSVREVSNNPIKIEGLNFYWPLWQWRGFKTYNFYSGRWKNGSQFIWNCMKDLGLLLSIIICPYH